jgi:hypothetical protein
MILIVAREGRTAMQKNIPVFSDLACFDFWVFRDLLVFPMPWPMYC